MLRDFGCVCQGALQIDALVGVIYHTVGKLYHIRIDMGKRVYHCKTQSTRLRDEFVATITTMHEIRARLLEEKEKAQEAAEVNQAATAVTAKQRDDATEQKEIDAARRQLEEEIYTASKQKKKEKEKDSC